jgi:hypothetical protein
MCTASLALRQGRFEAAAAAVDRVLARPVNDDDLARYAFVLRADIAARAGRADADAWYARALALAPDDVRTRAAYARHLAATGRHREVFALIGPTPETDGLALQQALSARALGRSDATALRDALERRFARVRALGSTPELRDEAEFRLTLRADAEAALALAQDNFATQKDSEDVDLLLRAATAAGRARVVAETQAWARANGVAATEVVR